MRLLITALIGAFSRILLALTDFLKDSRQCDSPDVFLGRVSGRRDPYHVTTS